MERRQALSFLLPLAGLVITVPELLRLIEARRVAEACLVRAQTEQISCEPSPDPLFLVVGVAFGLVFAARLVVVALDYWRASRL